MALTIALALPLAFLAPSSVPKQRTLAGPLVNGNTGMAGDVSRLAHDLLEMLN